MDVSLILWLIPVVILGGLSTLSILSRRGDPPGLIQGRLAPLSGKPNAVGSEDGTPDALRVDPLSGPRDAVRDAVLNTGGRIVSETDDYIGAIYTSTLFRFVDDLELRRDGQLWQIRSASRQGHSDLGANRRRVAAIRAQMPDG